MPAYVIAMVDVKDPVRYEDYRRLVLPTITAYGGRFVARGGRTELLEGKLPAGRLVIVEFPSVERAREWWASPEYLGSEGPPPGHFRGHPPRNRGRLSASTRR